SFRCWRRRWCALFLSADRPVYSAAMSLITRTACTSALAAWVLAVAGCVFVVPEVQQPADNADVAAISSLDPSAPRRAPLETLHYDAFADSAEMIGAVQVLFTRWENTFTAIA